VILYILGLDDRPTQRDPLLLSLFLICWSLQRGKGGGLVGALGGVGDQAPLLARGRSVHDASRFYVAAIWLLLTMIQCVHQSSAGEFRSTQTFSKDR